MHRSMMTRLGFYQRAVAMAPHPDKLDRGGEDSYMLTDHVIAVADGVGEHYVKHGIDAGLFAKSLTREVYDHHIESQLLSAVTAKELMEVAAENSASEFQGTSTLSIAAIGGGGGSGTYPCGSSCSAKRGRQKEGEEGGGERPTQMLDVANIGDSATLVLRQGKIIFKTTRQERETNHPFQIGSGAASTTEDAEVSSVGIQKNDLVLAITDGILDNLFDCQIESLIKVAASSSSGDAAAGGGGSPYSSSSSSSVLPPEMSSLIPDDYGFPEDLHSSLNQHALTALTNDQHHHEAEDETEEVPLLLGGNIACQESAAALPPAQSARKKVNKLANADALLFDRMTVQQLDAAARLIVAAARENSLRRSTYTPFTRSMTINGYGGIGNKMDDCTVVLGQLLDSPTDIRTRAVTQEEATRLQSGFMKNQKRLKFATEGISGGEGSRDPSIPPDPYWGYLQ